MKEATSLVNFPACPGDAFGASVTPIYQTATFDQDSPERFGKYDYTRSGNPTRDVLESQIAMLEGMGDKGRCFAFASGLAAITAVLNTLGPGDEVLACDDLYGGTYRLLSQILERRGLRIRYADLTDLAQARDAITPQTKLIFVESVSNPLMRVCDLQSLAELAHAHGAKLCVDNTFLSPLLMKPLRLGADYVVHSATKYLCGHSDVTAGVVSVADSELAKQIYFIQNGEGAGLGPQDSYLLIRGLKTLDLRLERQQRNANLIAMHLWKQPSVTRVRFPGLPDLPNASVHARQATGTGAVVCFETSDPELSSRIVENLRLFAIRVSFGSVSSSASLPCRMSHASIPAEVRAARKFPEDLIRLSVGIEDISDLLADLDRALAISTAKTPQIHVNALHAEPVVNCCRNHHATT